jgi:hypothetical protein
VRDTAHGFPITGLLVTRASVTGTPLWTITPPRSLAHAQSELDFRPVFSTQILQRLPKTQTLSAPMPSRVPAPRQHISGITQSIDFLGHPSHQGMRPDRLLPSLREPLVGYSVPCVHFP